MTRISVVVLCCVVACGSPAGSNGDGGLGGDGGIVDAGDAGDGAIDGGDAVDDAADISDGGIVNDASMGTLTPEPAPPSSIPCDGELRFPGPPALPRRGQLSLIDFSGDDVLDLVDADGLGYRLYLGRGDGTFSDLGFRSLQLSSTIVLDDVTGSTLPDFVKISLGTNVNTTDLEVLENQGDGTFVSRQAFVAAVPLSRFLAAADVNGDGRHDVVMVESSGDAYVFLNSSTGFGAPQHVVVAASAADAVALADVTGDGRADIITLGSSAAYLAISNGDGTFTHFTSYTSASAHPRTVGLIDLDEDGKKDVVLGLSTSTGSAVSVRLVQPDGSLGVETRYEIPGLSMPTSIAVADVDGDGHADVAVTSDDNVLRLYRGDGTGDLGVPLEIPLYGAASLHFGDLDRDGRSDLIASGGQYAITLLNTGTSSIFDPPARASLGVSGDNRGVWLLDLDGDDYLDLVGAFPDMVSTRLGTPDGFGATSTSYPTDVRPALRDVEFADVDNDGHRDVIMVGQAGLDTTGGQVWLNHGDGTLSGTASFAVEFPGEERMLRDFDGDGWRDLLIFGRGFNNAAEARLRHGLGNGGFAPETTLWSGMFGMSGSALDVDSDGDVDIVIHVYEFGTGTWRVVLLNDGTGTFSAQPREAAPPSVQWSAPHDLDHDGREDLVCLTEGGVALELGTEDGTLGNTTFTASRQLDRDPVFADFDGDGNIDIAGLSGPLVVVLLGTGTGGFRAPLNFYAGRADNSGPSSLSTGDIDGDGRLDLVVNDTGDRAIVLYGRCF